MKAWWILEIRCIQWSGSR